MIGEGTMIPAMARTNTIQHFCHRRKLILTTPSSRMAPALIEPRFRRQVVEFDGFVKPGTIIVDPAAHFLYQVRGQRQAMRYGVGVGFGTALPGPARRKLG